MSPEAVQANNQANAQSYAMGQDLIQKQKQLYAENSLESINGYKGAGDQYGAYGPDHLPGDQQAAVNKHIQYLDNALGSYLSSQVKAGNLSSEDADRFNTGIVPIPLNILTDFSSALKKSDSNYKFAFDPNKKQFGISYKLSDGSYQSLDPQGKSLLMSNLRAGLQNMPQGTDPNQVKQQLKGFVAGEDPKANPDSSIYSMFSVSPSNSGTASNPFGLDSMQRPKSALDSIASDSMVQTALKNHILSQLGASDQGADKLYVDPADIQKDVQAQQLFGETLKDKEAARNTALVTAKNSGTGGIKPGQIASMVYDMMKAKGMVGKG